MYGYKLTNGKEKVVIAGVKPNTVTYDELTKIWKGETISTTRTTITKDLTTLSIKTKVERGGLRPPLLTKGPRSGPFVSD